MYNEHMTHPALHKRQSFSRFGPPAGYGGDMSPPGRNDYRHRSMYGYAAAIPPRVSDVIPRALYFDSNWPLFAADWAHTELGQFIAVGTYNEEPQNRVHILTAAQDPAGNPLSFTNVADALVTLPQTKVMWDPSGLQPNRQLRLLSTGDCLRPWTVDLHAGRLEALTPLSKKPKGAPAGMPPAPLTSFDWSPVDPNLAITSSIDTTCTLWDLATGTVRTQLIAHDSDVYDVAFLAGTPHQFVSVGADGSVRAFDLRALESSTIVFEMAQPIPLLRIATSPTDPYLMAAIAQDSPLIYLIDTRAHRNPVGVLEGHQAPVNSIKWAPPHVGRNVLASGSDDCQLLLWDLASSDGSVPRGAFTDAGQINNVLWSPSGAWLGSISSKTLQGVRSGWR